MRICNSGRLMLRPCPVRLRSPSGGRRWVPHDLLQAALASGKIEIHTFARSLVISFSFDKSHLCRYATSVCQVDFPLKDFAVGPIASVVLPLLVLTEN